MKWILLWGMPVEQPNRHEILNKHAYLQVCIQYSETQSYQISLNLQIFDLENFLSWVCSIIQL